jgi:hypothetical protein
MIMSALTITDYLKYANLQMAAEAFLVNADRTIKADIPQALQQGNFHSSKFNKFQAEEFADPVKGWTVLDQRANTATGFSGTLFRNNQTGELVISFRSTEFIDDHARDNEATNALEVAGKGWAFGQIDDMEAWVAELKTDPDKLGDKAYSVTGYSLGGHLATAFNLLHRDDPAIQKVITFNGAGVGKITEGTLKSVMDYFHAMRNSPGAIDAALDDSELADAVRQIRTRLGDGSWTIAQAKAFLYSYSATPDQSGLAGDQLLVWKALDRMEEISEIATKAPTIKSGATEPGAPASPAEVKVTEIGQAQFNYQMAVQLAAKRTGPVGLFDNMVQAIHERAFAPDLLSNQYDVMGDTIPSAVANSQLHYGADIEFFIEDQPLVRGGIVWDVFTQSMSYWDIRLLVDGYADKDFGDTHSLVLLVDSLSVQNTLLHPFRVDSNDSEELEAVLGAAWGRTYMDWKADQSLSAEELAEGKGVFSETWLDDRSAFLGHWLAVGAMNVDTLTGVATPGLSGAAQRVFQDLASAQTITVMSDQIPNNDTSWDQAA